MEHTFTLIEPVVIDKRVTLGNLKALVAALESAGVEDKVTVFHDNHTAELIEMTRLELLDDEDLDEGLGLLEEMLK